MAVKYRAEYTSSNNIDYTIDISSDNYSGSVINIVGNAVIGLNSLDNLAYPIRSKFLRLSLLATMEQDLDDLFATNEREWKVELYKDVDKIFFGYLSSEGATQSFVTQERMVDFDVLDPIAFLEDLSYVDLNSSKFEGDITIGKILAQCLRRGFENQTDAFNILSYVNYDYETKVYGTLGYDIHDTGEFLSDVTIPQDNFYDEDSGEPLSCQEVLIDILSDLSLKVEQVNGSTWLIGHSLYDNTNANAIYINSFDKDGNSITDIAGAYYPQIEIKTDAAVNDPTDVIHVNENQSYFYKRGLSKLLINYQHNYKDELTLNSSFNNGVTGVSMPSWIVDTDYANPTASGLIEILRAPTAPETNSVAIISDSGTIAKGGVDRDYLTVKGSFRCVNYPTDPRLDFNVKAVRTSDGLTFYLRFLGTTDPVFAQSATSLTYVDIPGINNERVDFEFRLPELLDLSYIEIEVPNVPNSAASGAKVEIYNIGIYGTSGERLGSTYVVTADNDSSIKSDKMDIEYDLNESSTKSNQFYKLTNGRPITKIRNKFANPTLIDSIGELKGKLEVTRQRRRIIFNGDFYNYLDPSAIVELNGLSNNKFIPLEYSFDTYQNVGTIKLEERFNIFISTTTTEEGIYGETIKPTIE